MDTTDEVFLKRLVSSFLDAECEAQEMTRQQMYDKVKTHWKQDEGKKWDVPGGGRRQGMRKGKLGGAHQCQCCVGYHNR